MTGRAERLGADQVAPTFPDNTAESIVSYLDVVLECLNIPQVLQSVHGLPICSDTRKY